MGIPPPPPPPGDAQRKGIPPPPPASQNHTETQGNGQLQYQQQLPAPQQQYQSGHQPGVDHQQQHGSRTTTGAATTNNDRGLKRGIPSPNDGKPAPEIEVNSAIFNHGVDGIKVWNDMDFVKLVAEQNKNAYWKSSL